jgi:hypothetical protein
MDLYMDILPKTNCGDCGFATCLAFASMVVSEKLPLKNCPHLESGLMETSQAELDRQYAAGKWLKKDMARDALEWAKERAASMELEDLAPRIGGEFGSDGSGAFVKLPYFSESLCIRESGILKEDGSPLNRWEQVFLYNHMAQGGSALPTGRWKALEEIPNTVSKIKSMEDHVEAPLVERFIGRGDDLSRAAKALGGVEVKEESASADLAFQFRPLPRIPLMLLFWDEDRAEGFEAKVKLLFDETITEHLDIESMIFLCERLGELLRGE